jgi:hypothetical protein
MPFFQDPNGLLKGDIMSKSICSSLFLLLFVFLVQVFFPSVSEAIWVENGNLVCDSDPDQSWIRVASDGAGGVFCTWLDSRSGNYDIYAQWIDASGNPVWDPAGITVCTETSSQIQPWIIEDGHGGAIIAWIDFRPVSHTDIYAQKIDDMGNRLWTPDGVAICEAAGDQNNIRLVTDDEGGAIVAWIDNRNGDLDVYAQRVTDKGAVLWAADGEAITTATGNQDYMEMIPDGSGGAILTWRDQRSGFNDVYAQLVDRRGDAQWTGDGLPVCVLSGSQTFPVLTTDGGGGAIIAWDDARSGGNFEIYAQLIDSSGDEMWTTGGTPICTGVGWCYDVDIASDGTGGAILAWRNDRYGQNDIYAQRILDKGAVLWQTNGVLINDAVNSKYTPIVHPDGEQGAIILWADSRNGDWDVYAQRVDSGGNILWHAMGIPLCDDPATQGGTCVTTDCAGGVIAGWFDTRGDDYEDIYVTEIAGNGIIGFYPPRIQGVTDVPGDQGGSVLVSWDGVPFDELAGEVTEYTLWRALDEQSAAAMIDGGAVVIEDMAGMPAGDCSGDRSLTGSGDADPVLRAPGLDGAGYYWELIGTQPAYRLEGYSKAAATFFDSTSVNDDLVYFQVIAHSDDSGVYWTSEPDSGYSVDNLSPAMPLGLAGEQSFVPEGIILTWLANDEPDFAGYRLYRGTDSFFEPGAGNMIESTTRTFIFDSEWTWDSGYWYKLGAVDIHGNISELAVFGPGELTDDDIPGAPAAGYLGQNYPNPFNPSTTISFGLSRVSRVKLSIYDTSGRLVRVLVDEEKGAGHHTARWDGRNSIGMPVASGVYFYRLVSDSLDRTCKMVLLK